MPAWDRAGTVGTGRSGGKCPRSRDRSRTALPLAGEGVCFAVPPGPGWIQPDKGQGYYQKGARGDQRTGAS